MAYEYDNLGNPILVPDNSQGVSVVPGGAPTDTKIVRKPVQTVMTPEQMQNAAVKTANDLVKANIFAKTPAAQVYNPNPQSAEGVASDYRGVMQSIAQNPKGSVGSGVNTVKAAPSAPQITSMDELARAIGYTSPEQEERIRKASVNNQRLLAVTDALRHIGNIYHTVKGSPSQQFNSPVVEDYERYQKGKALRDAANARFMSYKQAKERQDALIKRYEDELQFKRDKEAAAAKDRAQKMKDARDKWQKTLDYRKDKDDREFELKKSTDAWRKSQGQQRIDIQASKAAGGGRRSGGGSARAGRTGGKYWLDDENGVRHYYPNKTMWEQGIYQYGYNIPQTENIPNGDKKKTVQVKPTKMGGAMARNAQNRNNRKSQTVKGSGSWGSFSIHK